MPKSPTYEELQARLAEMEAAEQLTKWHFERLAALQNPLDKLLVGIWEQLRLTGLADRWGAFVAGDGGLSQILHSGPMRPDLDPAQNEAFREASPRPYAYDSRSIAGAAYLADSPVAVSNIQGDDGLAYPGTRERMERVWASIGHGS